VSVFNNPPDAMDRVCVARSVLRRRGAGRALDTAEVDMPASKNTLRRHADCLTVLCPLTKSSIPTLIGTDVRTLAKAWHTRFKISCPHCQDVHVYRVCEAFVETAISNARLRGEVSGHGATPNSLIVSDNGRTARQPLA